MVLVHPVVEVGRWPSWQGRQVVGLALPARWVRPPDQAVVLLAWQAAQSPLADTTPWSKVSPAGITHGNGQDCVACHAGPGTGGAWGATQSFTGGHYSHPPAPVASTSCIACHMSQRPDLVIGAAQAAAALDGFDHEVLATGDCLGCHQATVAAGSYTRYYGPGGVLPGGDWKGAQGYPGDLLVSAPNQFVTVTEISLVRATPGGLVTGMSSISEPLTGLSTPTSNNLPIASSSSSPSGMPCSLRNRIKCSRGMRRSWEPGMR